VIISGFEGLIEGGAQLLMVKKTNKRKKRKESDTGQLHPKLEL
jgi:hypothetical protein